jgi:transposase-like protein
VQCAALRAQRGGRDTRAGHYERKLQTKAGEVRLKVPKLRAQTFETRLSSATAGARARSRRPCILQGCRCAGREIAAMLKAIHASEDVAAAREAIQVIEKLRGPSRRAGGGGGRGDAPSA